MDQFMTVDEVATLFNVSTRTVMRLLEQRKIKGIRVGRQWRIRREWVDAWIEAQSNESADEGEHSA